MFARPLILLCCLGCFLFAEVSAETIKIGATLALSGDGAAWGKNAQRGIQLAVDKVNASGGIHGNPIEVIFEDYRSSDFKLAASAAQKFISIDKVRAILTQWSGDADVVWPIATRAKLITFCIGPASDDLTQKSPLIFRVWPSDESLVSAIVEFALKQGHKRGVVVGALDPYFAGLTALTRKHWKEKTGIELPLQEVAERRTDFRSIALNVKRTNPDVIFIHTSYDAEGVFLKRLREIGVSSVVIGTQHSDDSAVISVAEKSAEGLIYPQYSEADPNFRAEFQRKFNADAGVPAEYAYDAIMILAHAMHEASDSVDSLRKALLSVQNYKGASGILNLDGSGNRTGKTVQMKIIKNGKGVLLNAK